MFHTFRHAVVSLAAITLFGGCIGARPYTLLKYDRQTDTFHELRIYADISGVDHYAETWRDRDRFIPLVACLSSCRPLGLEPWKSEEQAGADGAVMYEFAAKRLGNHAYCSMGFDYREQDRQELPLFDHISIVPGKLFLSPQKNLCYYHRVAMRGKALDESIADGNKTLCRDMTGTIEAEMHRRQAGGQRAAWGDLQRELIDFFTLSPGPGSPATSVPEKKVTDPMTCLEDSSLAMLLAAAKAKTPMYSRKEGAIQFALALATEDCRGAKAAFDAAQRKLTDLDPSKKSADDEVPKTFLYSFSGISVPAVASMFRATIEDRRFLVTFTVPAVIDLTPEAVRNAKPPRGKAVDYQRMVSKMRALGASIDEKLTMEDVIREFSKASPAATNPEERRTDTNSGTLERLESNGKIGFIDEKGNPDPDRLEKIALKIYDLREPQKFSWGEFVIDTKQRTYHADMFNEGLKIAWFYSGTFAVEASGQWTAGKPDVIEARGVHRHP